MSKPRLKRGNPIKDLGALTRRWLLAGAASNLLLSSVSAAERSQKNLTVCVAESFSYRLHDRDKIIRRFHEYKDYGIELLRASISFRTQDKNGTWSPQTELWFELAANMGFRFKIEFETLSGPPRWFLETHPDACIIDEQGEICYNDMNPFWSQLEEVLTKESDRLVNWWKLNGYMERTEYVIADLGPAGEPLYPATWTLGPGHTPTKWNFWFYGSGASEKFRTAMLSKFGSLALMNSHWGTHFSALSEVEVPRPHCCTTPYWLDVVEWYKNVKRRLVRWQLKETVRRVSPTKTLILVPGTHLGNEDIISIIKSQGSDYVVTLMPDTDFLIDLSAQTLADLQYTGLPNKDEIAYIKQKIYSMTKPATLWGENIGNRESADLMIRSYMKAGAMRNFAGLDLVDASDLYGPNGDSPTPLRDVFFHAAKNCM